MIDIWSIFLYEAEMVGFEPTHPGGPIAFRVRPLMTS